MSLDLDRILNQLQIPSFDRRHIQFQDPDQNTW